MTYPSWMVHLPSGRVKVDLLQRAGDLAERLRSVLCQTRAANSCGTHTSISARNFRASCAGCSPPAPRS